MSPALAGRFFTAEPPGKDFDGIPVSNEKEWIFGTWDNLNCSPEDDAEPKKQKNENKQ